ncbi:bacterial low temperature requirement A protein-domain-containing protein [Macrophomina phaseolina]|uniref:Bacterial low temperature requirement A protein-domain-containing protein n=1 Tax=Macrophomina phaseolina TaxID=35725 RepID=A0ABQ8GIQ0_9PEZI|nr:bacterial low temperature requirement A protein-domain-containing protein [Macrophomina phaseolina]
MYEFAFAEPGDGRDSYSDRGSLHLHDNKTTLLPIIESPLRYAKGEDPRFGLRAESNTIELFFDLFLIANLATFTANHSITDTSTLVAYIGLFGIIWFTWLQITLHDVRFALDSGYERACKVFQFVMFVGFALVGSSFNPGGKEHNNTIFRILCIMLFISRLLLAVQYGVALFFIRKKVRGLAFPLGLTITTFVLCGGAYYSMVPAFSASSGNGLGIYYVWYIIIGIEVAVVIGTASIWRKLSFKKTHLMERMGLLTLIIIGEGAIGATKTVAKLMSKSGLTFEGCFLIVCIVLILTLLFVLYFDTTTHAHFGSIRQLVWVFLNFPLHLGIVGIVEGSQQIALARACLTEHLSGANLTNALITTVKSFKLDEKVESRDQVPVILASIYAVGNATGVCAESNATAAAMPPLLREASTDVLGGLFESTGVKVTAGEDAFLSARSAYLTLYIYYWASVFLAMVCFAALFWVVTSKDRPRGGCAGANVFERLAIASRMFVAAVAVGMAAGAANHMFIYHFMKSPAVLPVVVGLLAAIVLCDRLGRWLALRAAA